MHRLWSDGRWNKITLAHGCYWKKCSFCDVSLDYIGRYDRPAPTSSSQRIRALIAETGQTGFHLVDEAAPPAGMRALAKRLLAEKLEHHVVGQHPLREDLHAGALRPARRSGLRRRQRRARGRVRSAARAHEEGRDGRAGRARDARVHRRRHHGARLSDVRLPDRDRAGDDRRARARAATVRSRAASSRRTGIASRDGALARSACTPSTTASRCGRRRRSRSRTTTSSSTTPSARITTSSAPACARRSTTTCTASASTPTCASGSSRAAAAGGAARDRGRRRGAARCQVPGTTVPPDLIARYPRA